MMKLTIKISILMRNRQLNTFEMRSVTMFIQKFRQLLITIISFHQVDHSYDPAYLREATGDCRLLLRPIIVQHLTEKSLGKMDMVFDHLTNADFLQFLFCYARERPEYVYMRRVCNDLNLILDGPRDGMAVEGGGPSTSH